MRTLGRTLVIASLMLACFAAGGQAAVIRVDRLTDRIDVAAAPDTCSTDRAAGEPASGTGGCTLRDAIDLANRQPGPDTILIDPEGWPLAADQGEARIPLAGPLPTITDPSADIAYAALEKLPPERSPKPTIPSDCVQRNA